MSKKASPAAIGGFVLGSITLLVGGIIAFSSGQLFRQKGEFVSYFPGTAAGLEVGAPVQFRGVQIGEVTSITVDYYPIEGRVSMPVYYDIWWDALRVSDTGGQSDWKSDIERGRLLIEEKGLRAQLTPASLVTGQYIVSLDLRPGSDYEYVGTESGLSEIPTIEATRDRLGDMLRGLDLQSLFTKATNALDGISAFVNSKAFRDTPGEVDRLIAETRTLMDDIEGKVDGVTATLDSTLTDYRTLANTATARITTLADALEKAAANVSALSENVNAKVDPLSRSATSTLDAAKQTLSDYDELVDPQSSTRANLDVLLEEAAGAARSLRILADYLEQNPDALIKGKY